MKPELFVLATSEEQALKSFRVLLAFDTIEAAISALKTMQQDHFEDLHSGGSLWLSVSVQQSKPTQKNKT